jgi:hypothetical protein
MLRARNTHVARATATSARLTMNIEMATLYSRFAAWRTQVRLANAHRQPEGSEGINRLFCDVLRHFRNRTVAKRRHSLVGAIVVAAGLVGGCASTTGGAGLGPDTPTDVKRDAVAARAKARWDALIKPDLESAYTFLSPASRATMSVDQYKAKHKVGMYRAVSIDSVECEADRCTVNLKLTYDYQRFKGMVTPLSERWIIAQGQAWFVEPR